MALTPSYAPTDTITGTATGQTLTGTSANNKLIAYGYAGQTVGSTLIGGGGDDSYYVHSQKDVIQEKSGEGIDTVHADFNYSLPAYVENLTLIGSLPVMGTGNAGNNIIRGNGANNFLDGAAGNDELTGSGGHDIFGVAGNDIIMDFGVDDYVNLFNYTPFTNLAQVKAAMQQVGTNVVLTLTKSDSVTFKNFSIDQFSQSNFLMRGQTSAYQQSFGDEFNSLSFSNGTSGTWSPLYPRSGLAAHSTVDHDSIQYFTFAGDIDAFGNPVTVNPHSVSDGVLSLTMDRVALEDQSRFQQYAYSSGMINSFGSFSQTYGYFEIRAKLPAGQGLHEAFWLLPVDGKWPPELDIMEQRGNTPNSVIGVAHAETADGTQISYSKQTTVNATTDFHTYGLDWEPDYLTWYVDGVAVATMPTWPGMDKPMYLIANIGGGGVWAGDPDSTTSFPASMQIDYIRVYASQNTVERGVPVDETGTDASEELFGTSLDDVLNGGGGDDHVYGGAGNDTLTGGGGDDILEGGFGDDTYLVLTTGDAVQEGLGWGIDTVKTVLPTYSLTNNVENLIFIGSGSAVLYGNALKNSITLSDGGGGPRVTRAMTLCSAVRALTS
jgi:serralysin